MCYAGPMARPLHILYWVAVYHLKNRGIARRPMSRTAADRQAFLAGGATSHTVHKARAKVQGMGKEYCGRNRG